MNRADFTTKIKEMQEKFKINNHNLNGELFTKIMQKMLDSLAQYDIISPYKERERLFL